MMYVYAAMLLHKAGKKVDEKSVEAVLKAAGVDVDAARVKATVAALKDVDIDKVISEASIAAPAAAPAAVSAAAPKEDKKEQKKEEKGVSEEEAAAGLGALFG